MRFAFTCVRHFNSCDVTRKEKNYEKVNVKSKLYDLLDSKNRNCIRFCFGAPNFQMEKKLNSMMQKIWSRGQFYGLYIDWNIRYAVRLTVCFCPENSDTAHTVKVWNWNASTDHVQITNESENERINKMGGRRMMRSVSSNAQNPNAQRSLCECASYSISMLIHNRH